MHDLSQTTALLARTPNALSALLKGLPDEWTTRNEGDGTWTVYDVIGHLVHGEKTDWMPRVRRLLEHGESLAFNSFDREAMFRESHGQPIAALLDEFARLRAASLAELVGLHLQPADFDRRGRHPRFGPVTLGQLLSTWATHDLTHLHQISRILAYQNRDAVGPWVKFLGVLHCNGHSE